MIFVVLNQAAEDDEVIFVEGGMCHFSLRRDKTILTVHEIIVVPRYRRQGIAERMVQRLREENPGYTLKAECPCEYPSNKFWEGIGCRKVGVNEGRNVWMMDPDEELPERVRPKAERIR